MRTEIAGRTAPVLGRTESQPDLVTPVRPSGQADGCGHRLWSGSTSLALPWGPGSSVGCTASPPWCLWTANSALGGYQAPQHHLSQGPELPLRGDNSGHSSNVELFALISLFQLACPTLVHRVGLVWLFLGAGERAATVQRGGLPAMGEGSPQWVHSSLQARAPRPEDLSPLLPQNSNASFSPVPCTWECGLSLRDLLQCPVPLPDPSRASPPSPRNSG